MEKNVTDNGLFRKILTDATFMSNTPEIPIKVSEPLKKGKFVFESIQEGSGEEKRTITFKPKLVIHYTIWEKKDPKTGKEIIPKMFLLWDFQHMISV